jgi:deoxyribodipyrimidine photo-lyase
MSGSVVIHWFRQDLRLADNPALTAAAETGAVVPVYILDDAGAGRWPMGGASRWWLHGSLDALGTLLGKMRSRLVLRRGDTADILAQLAAETGASAVHMTRCYEPAARVLEEAVRARLEAGGVRVRRFAGNLLAEPEAIHSKSGGPFRVFTPYWRACLALPPPRAPLPAPAKLPAPARWPASDRLVDWSLLPAKPDWAGGLRAAWQPGEAAARNRLAEFVDGPMRDYARRRDEPGIEATSRLSPHLHFGEVSPHQCWYTARMAGEREPAAAAGAAKFLSEIGWREFSYHLLWHWPDLPEQPFRTEFAAFPWAEDAAALAAWQRGATGYPIVDAGLRQLWQTGWMHNRVRMIVASFLVKHLRIPWQQGAAWFWDTLVDADLANNSASWQWVAGCGADAAPYFRVFNPMLQGVKLDAAGSYVRRYVPELARLPDAYVHAPWKAPDDVLAAAGVRLGKSYPRPIVEHGPARKAALDAFAAIKQVAASGD